jgi:hypothetical protein
MGLRSEVGKESVRFGLRQSFYRFPFFEDRVVRCLRV